METRFLTLAATILIGIGIASPVTAQDQEQKAAKKDQTITLDETKIQGRMQKPEAFYILQHSELNYEVFETEPTFIPELLNSVEDEPF